MDWKKNEPGDRFPQRSLRDKVVGCVERELIPLTLAACDGVQAKAAAMLGMKLIALQTKLKEYGLERK
jgi:DNA-binding protein Fis